MPRPNLFYGAKQALFDARMSISKQRMTAFIGPSDCDRLTLLRCLNRTNDLVGGCRVESGTCLDGHNILAKGVDVAELRCRAGMVFQKPNPSPKSIHENVVHGLRIQGTNKKRVLDEVVEWVLRRVVLWEEMKDRLYESAPGLSDGQQQYLVIARIIAMEPEVLLLDELCSALDPISTLRIEELIYELKSKSIIVTIAHNMQQAVRISGYAAFMYMSKLIEFGGTDTLFINPVKKQTGNHITGCYG